MHCRSFAFMVAFLLSAAAHAEGGDIIIVEPNPAVIAEAANTDATQALSTRNRGLLSRMVAFGCTRKARTLPDFIELSERHGGKDIASPYCQCFAQNMVGKLTRAHITTIIKTRKASPELQREMQPIATACIEKAIDG